MNDDKTVPILSYITPFGWIIALILHGKNKTDAGAFHLRQSLGLYIIGAILGFIPLIGWIASIFVFVLWLIGLIGAINGDIKPVPVVGTYIQDILKGIN